LDAHRPIWVSDETRIEVEEDAPELPHEKRAPDAPGDFSDEHEAVGQRVVTSDESSHDDKYKRGSSVAQSTPESRLTLYQGTVTD
jgi:hypothetical protein